MSQRIVRRSIVGLRFQKYGNLSVLLFGVLFDVALMPRGQGTAVDARFTRQSVQATADSAKQEKGNNDVESKSEGVRKATAEDRRRIAAERAFAQAEKMRAEWKEESLRRAMRKYEDARVSWRSIGSRGEEAGALSKIGEIYYNLSEFQKALDYLQQALLLRRALEDREGEIESLNHIGLVFSVLGLGQSQKTLDNSTEALRLSRELGYRAGEAQALNNMGLAHYAFGDLPRALELFTQALPIAQGVNDRRVEAQTLTNTGYAYVDSGDLQKALAVYQRALMLWESSRDRLGQARTLTAIGGVYSFLGEKQTALDYHRQGLKLLREIGSRAGEAATLNSIGYAYEDLGEYQHALDFYTLALQLFRDMGNRWGEAPTINYIGRLYFALGDSKKALECFNQSLSLNRAVGNRRAEAMLFKNIGVVYNSLGDTDAALEHYYQALSVSQSAGDRRRQAQALNEISSVNNMLGENQKALEYSKQALELNRAVEDRRGETITLHSIARLERDRGNLFEARFQIEAALKITESLRTKVASRELRTSYFASVRQHYDLYIDVLMEMNKQRPWEGLDAAALQASEQARVRTLLESLTEARADIRQGVDPALLERERLLQQLLTAKTERQTRLLSGASKKEGTDAVAKEIRDLTGEYEELQGQIRGESPRYAALTQPKPLGLEEIQKQVLDDQTLLLEYALGEKRSYLWAVSHKSINSYELPSRAEIEKAARAVYELLTARQPKPGETAQQLHARFTEADAQYWQKATSLSEILLGPVSSQLGTKRLLIVGEGALQYLPFGALPKPRGEREKAKGESKDAGGEVLTGDHVPLMVDHEIIPLPSASVMAVLRRETQQRTPPAKTVAVLADPVFETDDPRLAPEVVARLRAEQAKKAKIKASGTGRPKASSFFLPPSPRTGQATQSLSTPPSGLRRTLRDVSVLRDGLSFSRLLFSGREAEAIRAVAPSGQAMMATGFNATRAMATSPELSQYRIVHFATHGVLNDQHPGLSGVILSLVDEQGHSQDGFLRLHDIYNLNLPADLVVLSACSTALGKDVRGEGLVGIVRGFMYAGAARVVASLWKVDDEATAELMKRFYRHMLQKNLPAAAALRAAQLEMWQQKQWRSPYFWAAFALQGEWK